MKKLVILVFCLMLSISLTGCLWNMFGGGGGGGGSDDDDSDSEPSVNEDVSFDIVQSYATDKTVAPEHQWSNLINVGSDKNLSYKREVGDELCHCSKSISDDELKELKSKIIAADINNFNNPETEECQYTGDSSVAKVALRKMSGEEYVAPLICATDALKDLNEYIESLVCTFPSDCNLE